jgi:hypothetical protein
MKGLGIFLVIITAILVSADVTLGQVAKEVVVTNTAAAPVLVRSVDDPARRAFQLAFEVNSGTPATTPAGKIFVVEHVSGNFRLGTVTGSANPCRFLQLGLPVSGISGPPEAVEFIPTVMGTSAALGNDVTFLSINHPMKFYIRPSSDVGGVNSLLGGSCTASPMISSRIVLSGYLVDSQ